MSQRSPFEANLLRLRDMPPFVVDDGTVRNSFEVHVVNKRAEKTVFELRGVPQGSLHYTLAMPKLTVDELRDRRVPVFVDFPAGSMHSGAVAQIELRMDGQVVRVLSAPLITPN